MDLVSSGFQHQTQGLPQSLLADDEVVVLVDDDPSIREPIRIYFEEKGLRVVEAASGHDFFEILKNRKVALAVLDIGLPDMDGNVILPQIKTNYPAVGVLMLTGIANLETALNCLRNGADDYLSKPVRLDEIYLYARKILEKRFLVQQNRKYQEELETANFRIGLVHQLSLKMNSVYLNTVELDELLQAILVGITANEGLRFNRAFLAMLDDRGEVLRGRLAIGPGCHEEAERIWSDLERKKLDFFGIVSDVKACSLDRENSLNTLIRQLEVPVSWTDHPLIRSAIEKRTVRISGGDGGGGAAGELARFLGTATFVIVPLFSPRRSLGVIIADNFVTRQPITESYVSALELFSSQASLAIEHSQLYRDMKKTIQELESVNYELDKNKDMLIEAERYSALGQVAAQMVHNLRNPITSIGGVARILGKKIADPEVARFLEVMNRETARLENTLEDLFDFVSRAEIIRERLPFLPLVRKVLSLVQPEIVRQKIRVTVDCPEPDLEIDVDSKQVRKMIAHLVKNAIEAMPDGGDLALVIRREGEWLVTSIENTGKRIPDEYLNRAREPFFTTKTYGTGMGLAMVDKIAAAHGGNFTLQNKTTGTEVLVRLPLAAPPPALVHEGQ